MDSGMPLFSIYIYSILHLFFLKNSLLVVGSQRLEIWDSYLVIFSWFIWIKKSVVGFWNSKVDGTWITLLYRQLTMTYSLSLVTDALHSEPSSIDLNCAVRFFCFSAVFSGSSPLPLVHLSALSSLFKCKH